MSRKLSHTNDVSISPVYLSARSAIVQPERAISVTNYSLNKWLPRLGAGRWALVQYLRGLCIDSPRRADGTKRVTISWKMLAEFLQVHEETIASWLKHEVIPDDKPWRRIIPVDDYAEYLSLFIPRLRYAYETKNGKTRRVGFLLEVLMEDPIAPEDEIKLKNQVEQLQLQQGDLGLDTYRIQPEVNQNSADLREQKLLSGSTINQYQPDLPTPSQHQATEFTTTGVNPDNTDLQTSVKQNGTGSGVMVTTESMDLRGGKSTSIARNVNKLESYINQLKKHKKNKRNYYQLLEPVVTFTEILLDDYHSRAMLYKVAKALFPTHMDLYVAAVEEALLAYSMDETLNRGAIFVKTLRQLADSAGVDLGFRATRDGVASPLLNELNIESDSAPFAVPVTEAVWSETLNVLRGQMTKSMFNSVMQGTRLVDAEDGVYTVQTGSTMAREWLDNRLKSVVLRALNSVVGSAKEVRFL